MKVSIFLAHLTELSAQKNVSLTAALKEAKKSGVDYLEIDYRNAHGREAELKSMMDGAGLETGALNAWFDFGKGKQPDLIESALDTAAALNAPQIMAVPGFTEPGDDEAIFLDRLAEGLNDLVGKAAERGVSVVMENFDAENAPYGRMKTCKELLSKVPGLGCAFDTGNFLFFGEDVLKAYDLLEKRIAHVHMKDIAYAPLRGEKGKTSVKGKQLYPAPVGSGELPMAEIVRRLYERGYDGLFAIEHFSAGDQLLYMRRSARWLKNIFR
ncbi:MAG: sugar phosphate isomerase/epimerase [Clostridia bacterium]|nr:sugar phosphate isomerase/epimerase [Clostridia bacterium]